MKQQEDDTLSMAIPMKEKMPVDSILYRKRVPNAARVIRKAPVLDLNKEYATTKSYRKARKAIQAKIEQHHLENTRNSEYLKRYTFREKFTRNYIERQLANSGAPTVNSLAKVIARKRNVEYEVPVETVATVIRRKIQLGFSTRNIDFMSLSLLKIPEQLFNTWVLQMMHYIYEINLSDNQIRFIPDEFCHLMHAIQKINFRDNVLSSLPDCISKLGQLRVLILDSNQLYRFPIALPPKLKKFSAQGNRITEVPQIGKLVYLEELNLARNQLQLLPNALNRLTRLQKLRLSQNKLMTLAILPRVKDADLKETVDRKLNLKGKVEDWVVQEDPQTGTTVYFNKITSEITRKKPDIIQAEEDRIAAEKASRQDVPALSLDQLIHSKTDIQDPYSMFNKRLSVVDPASISERRKYPGGWEISSQGKFIAFNNRITEENFTTIPPELDCFGEMDKLKELYLNGNMLIDLPSSLVKLDRLRVLDIEHNRIRELPADIGKLEFLEVLQAGDNALSTLPASLTQLQKLSNLNLRQNRITKLPHDVGNLSSLKVLDLSCNNLFEIPGSVLQLIHLEQLKLQSNNELKMPSKDAISKGTKAIFWECRNHLQIEKHGKPPTPFRRTAGIGNECVSTDIHTKREFTRLVDKAKESNSFDFHWKRLTVEEIPFQLYDLTNLTQLRLTGHHFYTLPTEFSVFLSLRVLNIRQNEIQTIPEECFPPGSAIEELNLENNHIEAIPMSLTNLSELRLLRLTCNHLTAIPGEIGQLSKLEEAYFDHNQLKEIPQDIVKAKKLQKLDLSRNDIEVLDIDFQGTKSLTDLRLDLNRLSDLPDSLAYVKLLRLSLSGNNFHVVPPVLSKLSHLKTLYCRVNHLVELPVEFGNMQQLDAIELDGNPLRAPPAEIAAEGIIAIKQYLDTRAQRLKELKTLLDLAELEYNADAFTPKTENLITTDIEFLSPAELRCLDRKVDEYINTNYYDRRDRGIDIVNDFLLEKYSLAQIQRRDVLNSLLRLCELIREKRWLDKIDFIYDQARPWGEKGQLEDVFILNPVSIYESEDDGVPSILEVIKARSYRGFRDEEFPYTREQVDDALNNYIGPYGPVGISHESAAFKCGCFSLIKSGKMHNPCYRDGWIVCQIIYTQEEADRKNVEEEMIEVALVRIREELEIFIVSKEGKKRYKREVRILRRQNRIQLKKCRKLIPKIRKAIPKLEQQLVLVKDQHTVAKAERKEKWTVKEEKEFVNRIEDIQADISREKNRLIEMKEEVVILEIRKKRKNDFFKEEVIEVLLKAAGAETRTKIITKQRFKAVKHELRRPWDGKNGQAFREYRRELLMVDEPEPIHRSNSELSDISTGYVDPNADSDDSANEKQQEEDDIAVSDVSDVSSDDLTDEEATGEFEENSNSDDSDL